jgi:hypothetical protein
LQQQQQQQGVRSALAAVADAFGLPADGLDAVADELLHDAPHAPSAEEQQLQQLDAALAQLRSLDLDESTTLEDNEHAVAGLAAAAAVPADADNEMGNACGNGKEEVMQDVVAAAAAADNDDEEDDNNSNDSDDCDRDARGRKRIARAPLTGARSGWRRRWTLPPTASPTRSTSWRRHFKHWARTYRGAIRTSSSGCATSPHLACSTGLCAC